MQNQARLKIWVCEFISAGGLANTLLPDSLLLEGLLMRDALLSDLTLAGMDCITSHDVRAAVPKPSTVESLPIDASVDPWQIWQAQLSALDIDAVWVIAPESDGLLEKCYALAAAAGKPWIGCTSEAIALSSSKSKLADHCAAYDIDCIPHILVSDCLAPLQPLPRCDANVAWVLKPDDGAGCIDTFYCESSQISTTLASQLKQSPLQSWLIQPYIAGQALSMSVIATKSSVQVVAVNTQTISINAQRFQFSGAGVHHAQAFYAPMQVLAEQLHAAIPGLVGYWGVDVILTPTGKFRVVEINPRLTTPYIALSQLLAVNPSQAIINAVLHDEPTKVCAQGHAQLCLNETHQQMVEVVD